MIRPMAVCLLVVATTTPGWAQGANPFPPGDGQEVVSKHCVNCHAPDVIVNSGKSRADWAATVSMMISMGAGVPDAETGKVVDYLARSFPPK